MCLPTTGGAYCGFFTAPTLMNLGDLDDFSESIFFFLIWGVVSSALLRFLSDELPMVVFAGYKGAGVV